MSVAVHLLGGAGNNFFQYALGRQIAEAQGLAFSCARERDIAYAGDRRRAALEELAEHLPNALLKISGREICEPSEILDIYNRPGWDGQTVDWPRLLAEPRHCFLRGFFQKTTYYRDRRTDIARWFAVANPPDVPTPGPRDVVLNVRGGRDYHTLGWRAPVAYYIDALAQLGRVERLFVCGVDPAPQLLDALAPYRPIVRPNDVLSDFVLMSRAHRLICANSTFAWWPAFLSDAETVIAPRSKLNHVFAFSGFGAVELALEGSRYREIACDGPDDVAIFAVAIKGDEAQIPFLAAEDGARLAAVLGGAGQISVTDLAAQIPAGRTVRVLGHLLTTGTLTLLETAAPGRS